jgi:outer membrane protein W
MKKVLLTAVAVLAFGFVKAQDSGYSKGNVFLTGSVGIISEKTADQKFSGVLFAPKAGYFVTENIAVGLGLGIQSSKDDNGVNTLVKNNEFAVGAFGRYYFTPGSQFSVFGQLGFDITSSKNTREVTTGPITTTTESKSNGFNVALAPGVNYFLSKHFALEATWGILSYKTDKPDVAGADATNTFNLGLDLTSINLGLTYKF